MNESLKEGLDALARTSGMDLFGVAPAERLAGAPPGFRPVDYLPEVKSVVVMGCHFPEAAALMWERSVFPYQYFCYAVVNKELGHAAFRVAKALEDAGYLALPFVPTVYPKDMDYKRQSGEVSHRHAAVAAGLAEFGLSGVVINETYGTRVRWITILTTAKLPADAMRQGQTLCDGCKKCIAACPSKALKEEFEESFDFAGQTMTYIRVDKHRCHYCIMGLHPDTGGIINEPLPQKEGRFTHHDMARSIMKAFLKHRTDALVQHEMQFAIDWVDYCGRCLHVCNPNPRDLQ